MIDTKDGCHCAGIVRRRLNNGITINYRCTDNEPGACAMRVAAVGGRSIDPAEVGFDSSAPSVSAETNVVWSVPSSALQLSTHRFGYHIVVLKECLSVGARYANL